MSIQVLCFGDSNTWGYDPQGGKRYPPKIRWTGVLQSMLGPDYTIIEEGLNGRTTNVDYVDRHGKNGRTYLIPCMDSHSPLDWVILSLGPNDTKTLFNRSAKDIADGMEQLVEVVRGKHLERPSPDAKIILVVPPKVIEGIGPYGDGFHGAAEKSEKLVSLYRAIAEKHRLIFVNQYDAIEPSPLDGVHLSEDSHRKIAKMLFEAMTA